MPWIEITRAQYQRLGQPYTSDMSDTEWALIARKMPPRRQRGRPREVNLREVVRAIFYIASTGCQWRALPKEFPPYSTVQSYFYAWRDTGRWHRIVRALVKRARRKLGRKGPPLKGDVEVFITLFFGTKRRADWDNFHKLSCDALSGIVYEDDSQIRRATVALAYDKRRPRIEVALAHP
jgi:transposase